MLAGDEKLVLVLRRHVKVLSGPILITVLCLAAFGAVAVLVGGPPLVLLVVGVVALVIFLRWAFWPWVNWYNTVYAITTRRLVLRTGVVNRTGHDMPLSRLNDVSFRHGPIERLLGCGTLVVESGGEHGQIELDDVPKVELVQRTLYRLSDELRGTQGRDQIDAETARTLDDAFDDEYRGPAGGEAPGSGGRRS